MASACSSQQFIVSPSSTMALRTASPLLQRFKGWSSHPRTYYHIFRSRSYGFGTFHTTKSIISCVPNTTTEHSDGHGRLNVDHIMDEARKIWETSPEPVKNFPWIKALENFVQLILDLVCAVMRYLSVPVLAVSTLSEMSYCAHERKMILIPIPLLVGIAVAGVLRDTTLELSPRLKRAEIPWHLVAMAVFFTLLKLPGPYYPYWGRILIPHFANGGLLRILWFTILWYRKPQETTLQQTSVDGGHSE
ncbi:PREDICTED: uncharacterized protein LOC104595869 [Nelumbo nucifera]|uniref:Uncharacterized protein LOC104595869 n=1 Tax=Nelumbo nucifera TaxID=4432 RepID=A0A1U8A1X0_NELNU|nr:PREDICTED: uncharacterized protein LOC104595869 [Nelumbo nucifera]